MLLISDAAALFDVAPGMVCFHFIVWLLVLNFLKVTDKTGAKSARAKTATKIPMPIVSTVSMPFDDILHTNGARQQNAHDADFQDSQRYKMRAVMNLVTGNHSFLRCYRHSAKLSRLLTAGTKSLLSLITSNMTKTSSHNVDASKQGNELQDWNFSLANGVQNSQQQQQQPTGSLEGPLFDINSSYTMAHISYGQC
jgi:hypothetical protein